MNRPSFEELFRERSKDPANREVPDYIQEKVALLQELIVDEDTGLTWWNWLLAELDHASQVNEIDIDLDRPYDENDHPAYPDQGLVVTGYEGDRPQIPPLVNHRREEQKPLEVDRLDPEYVERTLHAWLYYLELFNHPERLVQLYRKSAEPFVPPEAVDSVIFDEADAEARAITVRDLALRAQGADKPRTSRTERLIHGPFVNYGRFENGETIGRMQARNLFVGAANPDVFGSAMGISTMAQAHSLVCLARDGFFSEIQRQVDLARKVFEWNRMSPILLDKSGEERETLLDFYNHNVVGVVEASPKKAIERTKALYEAGVRTFRIYSPEPGDGPVETLKALRQLERENGWEPIEIFVGQIVDLQQALAAQEAGANALYVGIGGGGRCITGVVGNLTIDWPQLLWEMRGKIKIPIIVEGGASDGIGDSIVLGASGIGVAGKMAGNIENPGGYLVFIDEKGEPFVYYGGEAANRMRAMAKRIGPFGRVEFTEGETRRVYLIDEPGQLPTLLETLLDLQEGEIGVQVFQNADTIETLREIGTDSMRRESTTGSFMKNAH